MDDPRARSLDHLLDEPPSDGGIKESNKEDWPYWPPAWISPDPCIFMRSLFSSTVSAFTLSPLVVQETFV